MAYTPPDGDSVNFAVESYTVPEWDNVNFELGEEPEYLSVTIEAVAEVDADYIAFLSSEDAFVVMYSPATLEPDLAVVKDSSLSIESTIDVPDTPYEILKDFYVKKILGKGTIPVAYTLHVLPKIEVVTETTVDAEYSYKAAVEGLLVGTVELDPSYGIITVGNINLIGLTELTPVYQLYRFGEWSDLPDYSLKWSDN